ncbi:MAG: hypothetical protein M1305_07370, partial [Candidatus Marsarchaeota archaeon]|nr:hypothetical protein [Candidatus Marsarchaeota archaeon]
VVLILSMVSEYDQLKGGVEERDLAELLVTVASGFKRGEDIIKVAKWLLDAGVQGSDLEMAQTMARFCYEFLRDRLGEETLHIDKSQLLEQCVKAGHDCEGPGLATFVYAWVYRLLESGKPEDALDAVEQYSKYLLTDDLAYSLYDIANKLETSRSFHRVRLGRIYLMAARNGRLNGHLTFAKSSLSNAEGIRSRLTDEDFAREVQQEREEIERAAKELDADDEFQCTIERIRTTYRGKRIAVVGGATERALIRDLEQALGSGIEVEWYRSSLATHVNGSTSLEKGVRSGKTCLVVQLEQSGHSNVNGIKDKDAKVIFCQGCHWKTVIRRIGRELS